MFLTDAFAGRPTSFLYTLFSKHNPEGDGIILARGPSARLQRRLALNSLRQLGIGGAKMEARINYHKDELIDRLAEKAGKVIIRNFWH